MCSRDDNPKILDSVPTVRVQLTTSQNVCPTYGHDIFIRNLKFWAKSKFFRITKLCSSSPKRSK